jgi:hypothetical protein
MLKLPARFFPGMTACQVEMVKPDTTEEDGHFCSCHTGYDPGPIICSVIYTVTGQVDIVVILDDGPGAKTRNS